MSTPVQRPGPTSTRLQRPPWVRPVLLGVVGANIALATMTYLAVREDLRTVSATRSEPVGQLDPAAAVRCASTETALEVAYDRWVARFGDTGNPPSETDLVTVGYLRAEYETYDLIDDDVVAVPGGGCTSLQ